LSEIHPPILPITFDEKGRLIGGGKTRCVTALDGTNYYVFFAANELAKLPEMSEATTREQIEDRLRELGRPVYRVAAGLRAHWVEAGGARVLIASSKQLGVVVFGSAAPAWLQAFIDGSDLQVAQRMIVAAGLELSHLELIRSSVPSAAAVRSQKPRNESGSGPEPGERLGSRNLPPDDAIQHYPATGRAPSKQGLIRRMRERLQSLNEEQKTWLHFAVFVVVGALAISLTMLAVNLAADKVDFERQASTEQEP